MTSLSYFCWCFGSTYRLVPKPVVLKSHILAKFMFYLLHNIKNCSIHTHRKWNQWAKACVLHLSACASQVAGTSSLVVFRTVRKPGELWHGQDASTQSINFTERVLRRKVLCFWIFKRIYDIDMQWVDFWFSVLAHAEFFSCKAVGHKYSYAQ